MKNLMILLVLAAVAFGVYKKYFEKNIPNMVAEQMHKEVPMLDKSVIKSCASDAASKLTESEKQVILQGLENGGKVQYKGTDAPQKMQKSMAFYVDVMNCVGSKK